MNIRCELREGRFGFRLVLEEFAEAPALETWALVLGDCVHNLRSALDNLAFALARLEQDPPMRPGQIAFPICETKEDFDRRRERLFAQLPRSASELIERLQPFQRDGLPDKGTPDRDALVLLRWFSNADKHRVPAVVLLAPAAVKSSCSVEFLNEADAEANLPPDQTAWLGPLSPGTVLVEHRTSTPIASVKGQFDAHAIVAVETVGDPLPVATTIQSLGYYVSLVVEQFRAFF